MASRSKTIPPLRRLPRKRRRRRIASFALRLVGIAIVGVATGLLLFPLASKIIRPYRLGSDIDAKVATLQGQIERQSQENADLHRQAGYLRSSEGREAVARQRGFHRPGEIVYLQQSNP